MKWLNEPASWQRTGDVLSVSVDPGTDFWRETGYGYIHDNGHVYGEVHEGDVDVSVCVRGAFGSQYDQAGIMLRIEERVWLKTGVEFFEGRPRLSTVLTLGRSSWIVTDLPEWMEEITLRASRRGDGVEVRYLVAGGTPELAALIYLPPGREVLAGIMCAAPEGPGFRVSFSDLRIERGWSARLAKMAAERREDAAAEQNEELAAQERDEAVTGERDEPAAEWGDDAGTGELPETPAGWGDDAGTGELPETPAGWGDDAGTGELPETPAHRAGETGTGELPQTPAHWGGETGTEQAPEPAAAWGDEEGDDRPGEPAAQWRGDALADGAAGQAGEPGETGTLGWAAAPVSETDPHWPDEPARVTVRDWELTLPDGPGPRWPDSASQSNGSGWFGDSGDATETRWFGKIPAEAGLTGPADELAPADAEGAGPAGEPALADAGEPPPAAADAGEPPPAAADAGPGDEPAQASASESRDDLEPLSPAESPRADQQPQTAAETREEPADLSRESSDDTTLKWLAELRDDSDPLWANESSGDSGSPWPKEPSHPSGPLWPGAAADDSPPAWTARTPTEGYEWPKSRPKGAAADWDRLVAGSQTGAWVPPATPDVGDRWPGPPLLDIAARDRDLPEPRPVPPVAAPRSWAQPDGLGNHTSPGENGTEETHGRAESTARRNPPDIDLPPPPDPADEWISLLTADPAEE